jgi:hypothetical protein
MPRARAEDAIGGTRHTAFFGGRVHGPHVEILAVFLERRRGEQRLRHTAGVAVPLLHFGCGVAVAHQQQVDLVAWRAVLHHRPGIQLGRRAAVHPGIGRIHHDRPHLAELTSRTALLDHDLHRSFGRGEADTFREGAALLLRLVSSLPLAVNAGESARINHAIRGAIQHLKAVFSEIALVGPAI